MNRSEFLRLSLASGLLALGAKPTLAKADHLHVFVPANSGGGWDLTGRALGQALIESGQAQRVHFEHRGGAAGTIGLAQFAKAYHGDPNALMIMGAVMLGGIITGRPPVGLDHVKPIARLTNEYNVIVAPAKSPFDSMHDVLRQFRNNPRSIKWGGGSRGSTEHVAVHMLAKAQGINSREINYVPFRGGGEAATAILQGYVHVGGSGLSEFLPYLQSGQMRALAVTAPQRISTVPAPTLKELGVDVEIGNWRGVCAPAGLSDTQYQLLLTQVQAALVSKSWQQALQKNQWLADPLFGTEFETFVQREMTTQREILGKAGLA